MIKVQNNIYISPEEVQFRYSRSSGPGGQKVNKTNSRVELVWDYTLNTSFSAQELDRLKNRLSKSITKEHQIIVYSETYRTQLQNRSECIDKLKALIISAVHIDKKRVKTKPSRNEKARRIESKKNQSDKKKGRKKVTDY